MAVAPGTQGGGPLMGKPKTMGPAHPQVRNNGSYAEPGSYIYKGYNITKQQIY